MAERIEDPEVETPDSTPAGADTVAAAMTAALRRRRAGAKADPEFDDFLREQTRFVRLQTEHLHEQRQVILSRLKWGRYSDRMKALLQTLTVLVGLAIAAAVGVMAWQAHEDHGVAIEAFSVPPDLAQRGLTGQVVANRLLGRLADLQAKTVSHRPASSYANDWGDDIKVEIPETGVSIGELNRYLRDWLGSETRITGDVVRTPTGIAVTAQAGASAGSTFEGTDADLPRLIQQAAEAIYAQTQPYRYAVYLASEGKADQALQAYARLAGDSEADQKDRAWAYVGWATLLMQRGDPNGGLTEAAQAIKLDPWIEPIYPVQGSAFARLSREGDYLTSARDELGVLESGRAEGISRAGARAERDFVRDQIIGSSFGNYGRAIASLERMPDRLSLEGGGNYSFRDDLVGDFLALHDVSGAQRQFPAGSPPNWASRAEMAGALDDWSTELNLIDQQPRERSASGYLGLMRASLEVQAARATLLARLGRITEARAAIAPTPLDCTDCLAARGQIAAYAGDRKDADHWFGEAVKQAPLPDKYLEWGQTLLFLHDPDAAIVELKQAHKLGPHFADPLETWGEALMAEHEYAGAISKFAEADKDAPKWGRNHLRWGEALMLSGHYAEARAQYQIANGLDLSVGDRAALNVLLARTASGPLHG